MRLFVGPRVEAGVLRIPMPLALLVVIAQGFPSSISPSRSQSLAVASALVLLASLVAAVAAGDPIPRRASSHCSAYFLLAQ
jgi:hypothetical protein